MDELFVIIISALFGALIGMTATAVGVNAAWQNDCEKLGQSRVGNVVYKCEKMSK